MTKRATISWPIALGLLIAVIACFAPALGNGFVDWDDDLNLTDNARYRGLALAQLRWMFTTTLGGHYQPLTWLSFAVDHALWGMQPGGYHLTSLVLHAANALVLYLVLQRLLLPLGARSESRAARRGDRGNALLRDPSAARRVGGVGLGAPRRAVGTVLAPGAARLPAGGRRRPATARDGCSARRSRRGTLAAGEGVGHHVPARVADPRRLPAPPSRPREARDVLLEKLPFAVRRRLAAVAAFLAQRSVPEMRTLADHGIAARLAQAAYGLCFYLVETSCRSGCIRRISWRSNLDPTAAPLRLIATCWSRRRSWRSSRSGAAPWPWLAATWAAYVVIVSPVLGLRRPVRSWSPTATPTSPACRGRRCWPRASPARRRRVAAPARSAVRGGRRARAAGAPDVSTDAGLARLDHALEPRAPSRPRRTTSPSRTAAGLG